VDGNESNIVNSIWQEEESNDYNAYHNDEFAFCLAGSVSMCQFGDGRSGDDNNDDSSDSYRGSCGSFDSIQDSIREEFHGGVMEKDCSNKAFWATGGCFVCDSNSDTEDKVVDVPDGSAVEEGFLNKLGSMWMKRSLAQKRQL
jgi:hypothetical protein